MNRENLFILWMENNLNIKYNTINKYARAIATISKDMTEHTGKDIDIYELNEPAAIEGIRSKYLGIKELCEKDKRGNQMYTSAIRWYEKFLEMEKETDESLLAALRSETFKDVKQDFQFNGEPKEKKDAFISNNKKIYHRDKKISMNALAHAHYCCEVDSQHHTFTRKGSDKNYTEPHHLIPMKYSDDYRYSLDVEENIVSLCSNCHNHLHYGQNIAEILKKLYEDRKDDLRKVGIETSFEDLLEMYK